MKRLALGILLASVAGAACAADLPAPPTATYSKAPPIVSPVTNWSGFYVGAMGGYASENNSDGPGVKGGFGGGTVGYNWQFSNIVAGIEADGAFADVSSSINRAGHNGDGKGRRLGDRARPNRRGVRSSAALRHRRPGAG